MSSLLLLCTKVLSCNMWSVIDIDAHIHSGYWISKSMFVEWNSNVPFNGSEDRKIHAVFVFCKNFAYDCIKPEWERKRVKERVDPFDASVVSAEFQWIIKCIHDWIDRQAFEYLGYLNKHGDDFNIKCSLVHTSCEAWIFEPFNSIHTTVVHKPLNFCLFYYKIRIGLCKPHKLISFYRSESNIIRIFTDNSNLYQIEIWWFTLFVADSALESYYIILNLISFELMKLKRERKLQISMAL